MLARCAPKRNHYEHEPMPLRSFPWYHSARPLCRNRHSSNYRADRFAFDHQTDVSLLHYIEHTDREFVLFAESDRREIHDSKFLGNNFIEANLIELGRIGVDLRVRVVNAFDT